MLFMLGVSRSLFPIPPHMIPRSCVFTSFDITVLSYINRQPIYLFNEFSSRGQQSNGKETMRKKTCEGIFDVPQRDQKMCNTLFKIIFPFKRCCLFFLTALIRTFPTSCLQTLSFCFLGSLFFLHFLCFFYFV